MVSQQGQGGSVPPPPTYFIADLGCPVCSFFSVHMPDCQVRAKFAQNQPVSTQAPLSCVTAHYVRYTSQAIQCLDIERVAAGLPQRLA